MPVVALLAWLLVPAPLGFDGWRWVVLIGSAGAIFVWWLRLGLPESPRWLARHGRVAEAERGGRGDRERRSPRSSGSPPAGARAGDAEEPRAAASPRSGSPAYRGRAIMLSVFNFFQTFGFYGFAAWVPTLLIAKGINVTTSLRILVHHRHRQSVGPLVGTLIADRMERKWQIVTSSIGIGVFGVLFADAERAGRSDRARVLRDAVQHLDVVHVPQLPGGAVPDSHPLARRRLRVFLEPVLSAIFTGFFVAFFLKNFGVPGVFAFIAVAMAIVAIAIGAFGPRTNHRPLEEISH